MQPLSFHSRIQDFDVLGQSTVESALVLAVNDCEVLKMLPRLYLVQRRNLTELQALNQS